MQLQGRLSGVYCVSGHRGRFAALKGKWERLGFSLPMECWPSVNGFSRSLQDDVPRLVETQMLEPAGLPRVLVRDDWREAWRREKKWLHVRRGREAPGRGNAGWLFDLDLTRGALGHALSHLELWLHVAKKGRPMSVYLVLEDRCRFLPQFCQASLASRLESVPSGWDIVFLGGTDLLGSAQARHQVAPGVRSLYPWFRAGSAYLLTVAGARRALQICTPLRWRLDCQLVGYFSSTNFRGSIEDRLYGRTKKPVGYCFEPPLVAGITRSVRERHSIAPINKAQERMRNSHPTQIAEQRMMDELDAIIAWSMRLTDRPLPVSSFARIWHPDRKIEGHSNMVPEARRVFQKLASDPHVKNICEVGFNAGHSALRWLFYSQAHVYSFDLGEHHYAQPAALWLSNRFPGRLDVIWGDSLVTVPRFYKDNPHIKIDIIFIDGGHSTDMARADLRHFAAMANPFYNRVILDDTFLDFVKQAWDEMVLSGEIEELEQYSGTLQDGLSYGFTVGRYTSAQS